VSSLNLSTVHFSQVLRRTALKLPVRPESPTPCPYTHMDSVFFGWPLRASEVPTRLIATEAIDPSQMTDIHRMEFHFVLSDRLASVFKRFDLGRTRVTQVPIINTNGTELPGRWHHCHIAERKDTLVPIKSDAFEPINMPRGLISGWPDTSPGAIAVESSTEDGVDLWRDPMWDFGMFASRRLVDAIKAEGLDTHFQWMPARRATDEDRANSVMQRQNAETQPPADLLI